MCILNVESFQECKNKNIEIEIFTQKHKTLLIQNGNTYYKSWLSGKISKRFKYVHGDKSYLFVIITNETDNCKYLL